MSRQDWIARRRAALEANPDRPTCPYCNERPVTVRPDNGKWGTTCGDKDCVAKTKRGKARATANERKDRPDDAHCYEVVVVPDGAAWVKGGRIPKVQIDMLPAKYIEAGVQFRDVRTGERLISTGYGLRSA